MNLNDFEEMLWRVTGYPDTANSRRDARLQSFRDAFNTAQDEISATCSPRLDGLTRESTFDFVAGTALVTLDDWCQRLMDPPYDATNGWIVPVKHRWRADYDGSRSTQLTYVDAPGGPSFQFVIAPRTSAALVSGASGASTGATATEGATTVSFGSSGTVLTSALIGRMLTLNGENGDYKILTVPTSHSVTVDRPIVSRLKSVGQTGIGVGYTNVRWDISPKGRTVLRCLPTPTSTKTVNYRYMALPRKLLNADQTPDIQEEYHHLIWKGALRIVGAEKSNESMYQMYAAEYAAALDALKKSDIDESVCEDGPRTVKLYDDCGPVFMPGTDRGRSFERYWGSV